MPVLQQRNHYYYRRIGDLMLTAAPVTFTLALIAITVGIFTSDALTVIGCWVLVGAWLAMGYKRETRSNA